MEISVVQHSEPTELPNHPRDSARVYDASYRVSEQAMNSLQEAQSALAHMQLMVRGDSIKPDLDVMHLLLEKAIASLDCCIHDAEFSVQ